ncbi:MAG: precorrin-2 C(20)-methyltransferase [Rhodospirillaceae bacterium]|nr:precorrin-2 C(20)-methyltransferase [Rhodospirillales bacterium]
MSGTLYGIGIGPGDPELLTLKAVRLIAACPVLAWPAPLEGDGLARTIAAPHVPAGKTEIAIRLSFRPERDDTDDAYNSAAATIANHLEQGRDVAVLCEGDPLFFGSFIYLMTRLRGRFPVQVVPGIASPMAAAAVALHPLSTLEDAVAIIPATRAEAEIERLLQAAESAVIMKIGRHLPKVRRVLDRLGLTDKALVVERATQQAQRLIPLAHAVEAPYFSLILVHA